MSAADEKLRWEGSPAFAQDAKIAAGCSSFFFLPLGLLVALASASLLPLAVAALLVAAVTGIAIHVRRSTRYRVTNGAFYEITPWATKRWLIPADAPLSATDAADGSVDAGECPLERFDAKGALLLRSTDHLAIKGLGRENRLVLAALEEARTEETFPIFVPAKLSRPARRFCAPRSPQSLEDFAAATPEDVPPFVARTVRGTLARACSLPTDAVRADEKLAALLPLLAEPMTFLALLEVRIEPGLSEDGILDVFARPESSVRDLVVAVNRARDPRGARPRPRG